jgi:hypothetical protein
MLGFISVRTFWCMMDAVSYFLLSSGSLTVISVTGLGVSVVDFLCNDQRKPTIDAVLSWFISMNPRSAREVNCDRQGLHRMGSVSREIFRGTRTSLPVPCNQMVWHGAIQEKVQHQASFACQGLRHSVRHGLCEDIGRFQSPGVSPPQSRKASPKFLVYLEELWYRCRHMWSDCERDSALNTTTSRIESAWNQTKKVLGEKLRIDLSL